jgi:hypothetical protein
MSPLVLHHRLLAALTAVTVMAVMAVMAAATRHERPDLATQRDLGPDAGPWRPAQAEAEGRATRTWRHIGPKTTRGAT